MVQVGTQKPRTGYGGDKCWDALLGSLRFGSRLHSRPQRSSCCRAAHGMAAIGCYSAGGSKTRAAMYDGTGSQDFEQFDAIRS